MSPAFRVLPVGTSCADPEPAPLPAVQRLLRRGGYLYTPQPTMMSSTAST